MGPCMPTVEAWVWGAFLNTVLMVEHPPPPAPRPVALYKALRLGRMGWYPCRYCTLALLGPLQAWLTPRSSHPGSFSSLGPVVFTLQREGCTSVSQGPGARMCLRGWRPGHVYK